MSTPSRERRDHRPFGTGEERKSRGEHGGHHRSAHKPLDGAEDDHRLDIPRHAAEQTRQREQHRGQREDSASKWLARERRQAGSFTISAINIGGLHPSDFVGPADSPPWMALSEAATICVSSRAMNWPKAMTPKMASFMPSRIGAGDPADWLGILGRSPLITAS